MYICLNVPALFVIAALYIIADANLPDCGLFPPVATSDQYIIQFLLTESLYTLVLWFINRSIDN